MSRLISDAYQKLNYELHQSDDTYGRSGRAYAVAVAQACRCNGFTSVIDFGCGKGTLKTALAELAPALIVTEYDPAIPGKDVLPTSKADFVVCTDVLEHVEPEHLDDVLGTIRDLSARAALLEAATKPARKTLADGRNAHLIVKPAEWWVAKASTYFRIIHTEPKSETQAGVIIFGAPITSPASC